jgi:hypothetical protein
MTPGRMGAGAVRRLHRLIVNIFADSAAKGVTDYLTVVTSQTAVLQTQLEALNLDTLQLRASVDLIRALGVAGRIAHSHCLRSNGGRRASR